jgi:hypothetical protein
MSKDVVGMDTEYRPLIADAEYNPLTADTE